MSVHRLTRRKNGDASASDPKSAQREQLIHRTLALHFMLQLTLSEDADARLKTRGMGRVHHRILYLTHFSPGITVGELLSVLNVRHQNIQAILRELTDEGYVSAQQSPNDARIKHLYSSPKGDKLLRYASADQYERIELAYHRVSARDAKGYLKVMAAMLEPDRREWVDRLTSLDDRAKRL